MSWVTAQSGHEHIMSRGRPSAQALNTNSLYRVRVLGVGLVRDLAFRLFELRYLCCESNITPLMVSVWWPVSIMVLIWESV